MVDMLGLKNDWLTEGRPRTFVMEDYAGAQARWCPGCGDHAVLNAVQKLCREEQLIPEKTVFVSGIGCSSRFPHYMKTYGFHGLHGRAFPIACGVKSRRPDLDVFVSTGDGDCCSIGAGHWIHALRYNMDMTVMLFDNNIYGLTKKQTSPTSHKGYHSNTHPDGALMSPLNPITVAMGITNVSFVAQTVDWHPGHLYATLEAGYRHKGTAFIRIMQRCPHFTADIFKSFQEDPAKLLLLEHDDGIKPGASTSRFFKNHQTHDPRDRASAYGLALREDVMPIGLLYWNPDAERYDDYTSVGCDMGVAERLEAMDRQLDKFLI